MRIKTPWRLNIGSALLLFLGACATEVGNHTFVGKSYPPKPQNYSIDVYTNAPPNRSFERVAILDVHCEAQGFQMPNLASDGLPKLINEARLAGCDAIMDIRSRVPTNNWTLETKVIQFSATGIVYK